MGYRWVSGVSPRDLQAAATKCANGVVHKSTQGTLVRNNHTMHENKHIVVFANFKKKHAAVFPNFIKKKCCGFDKESVVVLANL